MARRLLIENIFLESDYCKDNLGNEGVKEDL
jgi:hypothetical protein